MRGLKNKVKRKKEQEAVVGGKGKVDGSQVRGGAEHGAPSPPLKQQHHMVDETK